MIRRSFVPIARERRAPGVESRAAPSGVPIQISDLRALGQVGQGVRVVIVGAGMAGLSAAYELSQLGFEVMVLEADPAHRGGRVRTWRRDGLHGDLGAMRIPLHHDLTRFYIGEAKLALREFVIRNNNAFLLARNVRTKIDNITSVLNQFGLTPEERQLGDGGMFEQTMIALVDSLSDEERADLYADKFQTARIAALDRRSLYDLFASGDGQTRVLSAEGIQCLGTTFNIETALHISLSEHLREELEQVWVGRFHEIEGGMDQLPAWLAERLGARVSNGCIVRSIERKEASTTVTYEKNKQNQQIEAAWVLCTVPLSVISTIHFDPQLSSRKADAVRRVGYDSSTKVLAVAQRRFWEQDDKIFGGGSVSDGPLGSTWYPSDNHLAQNPEVSAARSVFLASYSWGQTARRMATADHQRTVVPALSQIHDSVQKDPALIEDLIPWSWDRFSWSRGAYAFFNPGDQADLYDALIAPEGSLLLAGEHASTTHSWIQGAIQSGLRAALHVATRIKP